MGAVKVGIDVSAASIVAHSIDIATGESQTRTFGGDDFVEVTNWIRSLGSECTAAYEAGSYGYSLARFLNGSGVRCVVTDPHVLGSNRKKTDKDDAAALAKLLVADAIQPVRIPTEEQEALRDLARLRYSLVKSRAIESRRLRSYEFQHRMEITAKDLDENVQLTHETLIKTVDDYDDRIDRLDIRIAKEVESHSLMKSLTAIAGVGCITAFTAVAEAIDFNDFSNARAYSSYIGLVPRAKNSGLRNKNVRNPARTASGFCFYNAASSVFAHGVPEDGDEIVRKHNEAIGLKLLALPKGEKHRAGVMARVIAKQCWMFAVGG